MPRLEGNGNLIEAIPVPGVLSFMAYNDFSAEVKGLNDFAPEDRPPVLISFLSFRGMVGLGVLLILLAFIVWRHRNTMPDTLWLNKWLPYTIPLPYLAIMAGWTLSEVGRQPWIVYGLLRTSEAASPVPAYSVGLSLVAFFGIYTLLGLAAAYMMHKHVCAGPRPQA
jgi:cytochrome d ubiquinol oxidase subunit I